MPGLHLSSTPGETPAQPQAAPSLLYSQQVGAYRHWCIDYTSDWDGAVVRADEGIGLAGLFLGSWVSLHLLEYFAM